MSDTQKQDDSSNSWTWPLSSLATGMLLNVVINSYQHGTDFQSWRGWGPRLGRNNPDSWSYQSKKSEASKPASPGASAKPSPVRPQFQAPAIPTPSPTASRSPVASESSSMLELLREMDPGLQLGRAERLPNLPLPTDWIPVLDAEGKPATTEFGELSLLRGELALGFLQLAAERLAEVAEKQFPRLTVTKYRHLCFDGQEYALVEGDTLTAGGDGYLRGRAGEEDRITAWSGNLQLFENGDLKLLVLYLDDRLVWAIKGFEQQPDPADVAAFQ